MVADSSPNNSWVKDSILLNGQEIPVKTGYYQQSELSFFPDNPRLYSIVHAHGGNPSQDEIERQLADMEHVRALTQSIRANNGLTDPIIVRELDLVVLEGNSRLAAYRILARNDPIKWGMIKITLLPSDISEDLVFSLLGQYHIVGKKDWAPYEQAGYLYRRNTIHGRDPKEMARQLSMSPSHVVHLIGVYKFMLDHNDNNVSHWSYYDQYLKKKSVKKARENFPQLDTVIVGKIKSGEIFRATDIRENLPKIVETPRALNILLSGDNTFEDALDRTMDRNDWYRRIKRFRDQITKEELLQDLRNSTEEQKKKCLYELGKVQARIENIIKSL